ncbi:glycosyl hydrolase [Micromonospora sp. 4G57]|uniref:Glycosyl hydrolase n=1 Tax=Micromonospora sicca TaxID=2202420 RepID=A0ABU5JK40_9ACTN|nr:MULTISPECIES: glycosyl hydrolase [unclassified Micromonospora]MDZ5446314.1 glycosyl hydrolase [Micromonospora sp. 4G57]MDZ5492936.1 glycosyl hydrolase [Micromonospora sp. 4G53]
MAAVLTLTCLAPALAACESNPAERPAERATVVAPPPTVEPRTDPVRTTGLGPEPPEQGAWLGAWVKPQWHNATGRAAALDEFNRAAGGKLTMAHMFHQWNESFPGATEQAFQAMGKLQMISWQGTDTRSTVSGTYDSLIRQRAEDVKAFGLPVLLRYRWEMDRPNLAASIHSPEDYVAAWKHIRAIFTEVGVTNAGWVWCPHADGFAEDERAAEAYYPGDDQVDWLCADVYPGPEWASFSNRMDHFMAFAQQHPRPVVIGEYGLTQEGRPGQRAEWLREVGPYLKKHPQIKAALYFAAKQTTKPLYDSTFGNDPESAAVFREMATDPYFSPPPPDLTVSSGPPPASAR